MKRLYILCVVGVIVSISLVTTVGCDSRTAAQTDGQPATSKTITADKERYASLEPGRGMAALEQAAADKRYLFAFFWKMEDAQTNAMRAVLKDAIKEVADKANSVEVNVTSTSEKAIVDKYGLDRAPMPLILVIAPNGAITGGFPTEVEKQKLLDAFASPCTEKCMKHLQNNKLVFLCVQNGSTQSNEEAMKGVREFEADARFSSATEIIMLDPTDKAERSFLKDLKIDPNTESAITVFLVPPGTPVALYEGATNKNTIVETLQKAASSSCGPGGCGPGGCPPPK